MSDSVTVSVEVAVSPDVAFDVFTREIDSWYRVNPDALPDITRTAAIRFDAHVGGRLVDVHDLATGEGREIGRVTAWERGRRLAFTDNEGTEIEVSFEPRGAGTHVVLTHRGLDRLAPHRAAELRRSGWAALAPVYHDHVRANARPLGLAIGSWLLFAALLGLGFALVLALGQPALWISPLLFAATLIAVYGFQDRLIQRWQLSRWDYQRIFSRVGALLVIGLLIFGVYLVTQHGADALTAIGVPVFVLMTFWSGMQEGPANGRSLRNRAVPVQGTFADRHPHVRLFGLMAGAGALGIGLAELVDVPVVALFAVGAVLSLRAGVSKRRQRRTLGFDPDLYLAVARGVSEQDRRPELLVHRASDHSEYSGWYYGARQIVRCNTVLTVLGGVGGIMVV